MKAAFVFTVCGKRRQHLKTLFFQSSLFKTCLKNPNNYSGKSGESDKNLKLMSIRRDYMCGQHLTEFYFEQFYRII